MVGILEAVAAHQARNRELVKLIESKGASITQSRPIDLHFWVQDEDTARKLEQALQREGCSTSSAIAPVGDDERWSVEGHIQASVANVTDKVFTEKLVRLAVEYGGEFDGWGTSL
jgi:hypothetical protein